MKSHPIVVMAVHQILEVLHGLWRGGVIQLDNDALQLLLLADLDQHDCRLGSGPGESRG